MISFPSVGRVRTMTNLAPQRTPAAAARVLRLERDSAAKAAELWCWPAHILDTHHSDGYSDDPASVLLRWGDHHSGLWQCLG